MIRWYAEVMVMMRQIAKYSGWWHWQPEVFIASKKLPFAEPKEASILAGYLSFLDKTQSDILINYDAKDECDECWVAKSRANWRTGRRCHNVIESALCSGSLCSSWAVLSDPYDDGCLMSNVLVFLCKSRLLRTWPFSIEIMRNLDDLLPSGGHSCKFEPNCGLEVDWATNKSVDSTFHDSLWHCFSCFPQIITKHFATQCVWQKVKSGVQLKDSLCRRDTPLLGHLDWIAWNSSDSSRPTNFPKDCFFIVLYLK